MIYPTREDSILVGAANSEEVCQGTSFFGGTNYNSYLTVYEFALGTASSLPIVHYREVASSVAKKLTKFSKPYVMKIYYLLLKFVLGSMADEGHHVRYTELNQAHMYEILQFKTVLEIN